MYVCYEYRYTYAELKFVLQMTCTDVTCSLSRNTSETFTGSDVAAGQTWLWYHNQWRP